MSEYMELPQEFVDDLLMSPDDGTGIQLVTITDKDGKVYKRVKIKDCVEILSPPTGLVPSNILFVKFVMNDYDNHILINTGTYSGYVTHPPHSSPRYIVNYALGTRDSTMVVDSAAAPTYATAGINEAVTKTLDEGLCANGVPEELLGVVRRSTEYKAAQKSIATKLQRIVAEGGNVEEVLKRAAHAARKDLPDKNNITESEKNNK